jgi:hypothetical protein
MTASAVRGALVPHTVSAYNSATVWFVRFCEAHGLAPFPLDYETMAFFLTYIAMYVQVESGLHYISGLRNSNTLRGSSVITGDAALLRLCIRGLKRKYPISLPVSKAPITIMLLAAFRPLLDMSLHFDRLFWAASVNAVYQFWRGSEFLTPRDTCREHVLLKTDHTWGDEHRLHSTTNLHHTKTKWWITDVTTHAWQNTSITSPTDAMHEYLSRAPPRARRSAWLFANENGFPLSKPQMVNKTRLLATMLGLNPSRFIASSWRCGAATTAAHGGFADRLIGALGRWEGNSYRRYAFTSTDELMRAGSAFGSLSSSSHDLGEAAIAPCGSL